MPTVTTDYLAGGPSFHAGSEGFVVKRPFLVDGLSGDKSAILYQAYLAIGIGRGDAHPTIPLIRADTIDVQPMSPTQCTAVWTYRLLQYNNQPPGAQQQAQITVGSSIQTQQTNLDANGNLITVSYTPTNSDGSQGTTVVQSGTVQQNVPNFTIAFARREATPPASAALNFVGKVNSSSFLGLSAGTVLCTRINGVSEDGGVTFKTEYEFQYNANGWSATVVYIDPSTNAPPADASSSNGITTATIYKSADFSALSLA